MSAGSTLIGDRRRQALERTAAQRGHPSRRADVRPLGPPPTAFYMIGLVVTFLIMLGLVMVFSASGRDSYVNRWAVTLSPRLGLWSGTRARRQSTVG